MATSSAIDPGGARLATVQSGTTGYLLADLHGNLAAVVNAGETALLSSTRYDPFGQSVAAADSGGSFPTPWRFQGRLDLSPDNHPLYAFGARNYDPSTGAFTSLDSYAGSPGDPLSLNRFAYAEANPWTLVDPDGHMAETCGGQCGGFATDEQQQAFEATMRARAAQHAVSGWHANDRAAQPPVSFTAALAAERDAEFLHGYFTGTRTYASTLGGMLRNGSSDAGQFLRDAGSATKLFGTTGFRLLGRGLFGVGLVLEYGHQREEGHGELEAAVRTVGIGVGTVVGSGLGAAACGAITVASAGLGAGACAILVGGGGLAGGIVTEKFIDLAGWFVDRLRPPKLQ